MCQVELGLWLQVTPWDGFVRDAGKTSSIWIDDIQSFMSETDTHSDTFGFRPLITELWNWIYQHCSTKPIRFFFDLRCRLHSQRGCVSPDSHCWLGTDLMMDDSGCQTQEWIGHWLGPLIAGNISLDSEGWPLPSLIFYHKNSDNLSTIGVLLHFLRIHSTHTKPVPFLLCPCLMAGHKTSSFVYIYIM